MTTYLLFADAEHKLRHDGRHTFVAQGGTVEEARAAAEALTGQASFLADYRAVDITAPVPPFVVEGGAPVGAPSQSTWGMRTRGGDFLRG